MRTLEQVAIEDRQTVLLKVPPKTRWIKKRFILIVVLLLLLVTSSISTLVGYLGYHSYQTDLLLAQKGMQHLRSAMTLLESLKEQPSPKIVVRAQQEFAGALSEAQVIEAQLKNISGISGLLPVYGTHLSAAASLTELAVDISQAGISACKLLELVLSRLDTPLKASASTLGLKSTDFTTLSNEYQAVRTSLIAAMNKAALVQPDEVSFDAHLSKLLREFQTNIPKIRNVLVQADQLLTVLPTLLGIGMPAHYLVEVLDSTELRPGGGFIGNYGIATLSGGRLTSARITDVDLLDRPFEFVGHTIPFPPIYNWFARYLGLSSWSLRDSNLEADFPTSARNGEINYQREGGNIPLQGVIAITPSFIEQILKITGPISVNEYRETITAQNLVDRIHYHQLGPAGEGPDYIASPDGHSSLRKRFTELLGEHLLTRIQQLPSTALSSFAKVLTYSVLSKDVQIYLNASVAENILQYYHLADSIESRGNDSLFVVDANVGGNKANNFIKSTISDQVTIDNKGNASHHMMLRYTWTMSGNVYGSRLYKDYVRIYVPPGSTMFKQDGWQPLGKSTAFSSQVWTGFFTLVYGQTHTIILEWTSYSMAKSDANGWHYQFLLQRQAGAQRTMELQVMLPSCATVTNKWGGLISKGKRTETFTQSLTQDLNLGVDYVCK